MLWGGMLHHAPGGDAPPWTWRSVSRPYLLNYWSDFHEIWHAGPLGDLVVPFGDYIPVRKFPPKIRGKLYFFFIVLLVSPKIIVRFWWILTCKILGHFFFTLGVWTPVGEISLPMPGEGKFQNLYFDEIWFEGFWYYGCAIFRFAPQWVNFSPMRGGGKFPKKIWGLTRYGEIHPPMRGGVKFHNFGFRWNLICGILVYFSCAFLRFDPLWWYFTAHEGGENFKILDFDEIWYAGFLSRLL